VIGWRGLVFALLFAAVSGPLFAADQANDTASSRPPSRPSIPSTGGLGPPVVALEGKLKHPQSMDLAALRRLPAERMQVSFQTERGPTTASYTGPRLWAVLATAGGIDDDKKGAEIRHTIKVTGRDGYFVVLSTGEIAPEFGGKPAIIAYQRDDEMPGISGLRLIMPGDKRGGRDVRDVVAIRVE
jgi:hypothetical protein